MGSLTIWHWIVILVVIGVIFHFIRLGRESRLSGSASQSQRDQRASRSARNYDVAKWDALVEYDEDIATAEQKIRALGQRWVDELAWSYLAVNDKSYLPRIVAKIQKTAKAEPITNPSRAPAYQALPSYRATEPVMSKSKSKSKSKSNSPVTFEMSAGILQGLGIAALVCALIAIITPVYGIFISALALIFAVIAALGGDRVFSTVTPIVVAINIYFLSPALWFFYVGPKNTRY